MELIIIASLLLSLLIIVMAIMALYNKKLPLAIIAAGAVSLFASVLYLIMAAPDVAMTEASIGSALSTIIFFYVLNKIRRKNV